MKYYYSKRHHGLFHYVQHGMEKFGFRLTYYDAQHKQHERSSRGYKTEHDAGVGKEKAEERFRKLKGSKNMTFAQWCHVYLIRKKAESSKTTTYLNYYRLLTQDAIPYIGKMMLIDLKPGYYKFHCLMHLFNQKHLSRQTVVNVNGRVQTVMNDAVKNGLLSRNPLKWVSIPHVHEKPRKVIMTASQLKRFDDCLSKHSITLQAIFYTLQYTGMRDGELLALRWKDIDWDKHTIHIHATRDGYGRRKPKTKASYRTITMMRKLQTILRKYWRYSQKKYHANSNNYVIVNHKGNPLAPNQTSIQLRRLLVESGLKNLIGRFSCHSFRHSFISMMIGHGANVLAVSRMVGHTRPSTTLNIYAQTAPGQRIDPSKYLN